MHDKIAYLIKHYSWIQYLYRIVFSKLLQFVGIFVSTNEKLVLISSYGGRKYADSPKVLYEAMKINPRYANYEYVWAFENPAAYATVNIKTVRIDTWKYFLTALQAKIWITNVNIERGLKFKKEKTIYVNTWHGTGPKKGGNAVAGRKDYDFSSVDILCVDGTYMHDVMIKYFGATEQGLLYSGRPREDALFRFKKSDAAHIRNSLGISINKKIILYMPTWREYEARELNSSLWQSILGDEYVVLLRTHHFARNAELVGEGDFFIDVTKYGDVNELYFVADILVSDYSSAFFDYGLLGKPMFCYAYDYDRYVREYGLFMNLEAEFPRGIKRTEKELLSAIKTLDYEIYAQECRDYCNRYVSHKGRATEECLQRLNELLRGDF